MSEYWVVKSRNQYLRTKAPWQTAYGHAWVQLRDFASSFGTPEAAKAAESQTPNAAVAPATSQGTAGTPIQTDIGKLVVVYQPDADPYYPSFSKRAGEQGEVVVRLIIDETGIVEEVALLRSSGFPRLDRAASEIGKRYRFKPYSVNGNPARISTNLLIKFNLKN
jgi:protein TonB